MAHIPNFHYEVAQATGNHTMQYDENDYPLAHKLATMGLEGQRDEIQSFLTSVDTDVNLAANEPYGNGDQSIIADHDVRERARELFCIGGDIRITLNTCSFSSFAMNCMQGHFTAVRVALEEVCDNLQRPLAKQESLRKLLESRETSLRLSPLLLIVSAGQRFPVTKQAKIAKLLLRYGASPDAKDVCGKTVVHYGAGVMATPMTLEVAGMCIEAAKTSDMYGKIATLEGLQKAEMNGKTGCIGGYDVDSGRRGIYIPELQKDLWVKPSNIRITAETVEPDPTSNLSGKEAVLEGLKAEKMNGKEGVLGKYDPQQGRRAIYIPELKKQVWEKPENIRISEKKLKLSDVRDRFGGVSLHEVMMSDRVEVAEFLLKKHGTSIHTLEADGLSPMGMTMEGGNLVFCKEMAKMVTDTARAEAAIGRKEAKKAQKENFCANCNKSLGTGGMQCAKCIVTFYCGRECQIKDWKQGGHKQACKKLVAQRSGVKLCVKHCERQHSSVVSRNSGQRSQDDFRKPQGVEVDQKFVVKVQAISDSAPMMIYDETRQCQFGYLSTGPGFREVFEAVQTEPTWNGRKTFMKASFNQAGECTMYPATAGVKNKYSW